MEHRVHVLFLVDAVEDGTRDTADALGNKPRNGYHTGGVEQGLEGDEDAEPHAAEAEGLDVGVLFELDKTGGGAGNGAEPDKEEEPPAPVALVAQHGQRDG